MSMLFFGRGFGLVSYRRIVGGGGREEEEKGNILPANDHKGDPELWFSNPVVARAQVAVNDIVEAGRDLARERVADAEGDVVERGDGQGFVVDVRPEGGEGRAHNVDEAEDEGQVEGQELHNRLGEEEAEGPDQGEGDFFRQGHAPLVLVYGREVLVACRFPEGFAFA